MKIELDAKESKMYEQLGIVLLERRFPQQDILRTEVDDQIYVSEALRIPTNQFKQIPQYVWGTADREVLGDDYSLELVLAQEQQMLNLPRDTITERMMGMVHENLLGINNTSRYINGDKVYSVSPDAQEIRVYMIDMPFGSDVKILSYSESEIEVSPQGILTRRSGS